MILKEEAKKALDMQIKRVHKNKASLIIIDGQVGEGKTTWAVEVADYINSKNNLPQIDLKEPKQYAYGGEDFTEKLRLCYESKLPVCIYDEAGDFNKRGALTKFNKMLNRTFETFRAFKIIVILVLPSFHVLDNDLFDKGIPRLLFHCHGRTETMGFFKAYGLYRMYYLKEAMRKAVVKQQAFSYTWPNFHGRFRDLSVTRSKQIDTISRRKKLSSLTDAEISMQGLLTYKDLSRKFNRTTVWVRVISNKLKIKPIKMIRRRQYFDESVIELFENYLEGTGRRN